MHDTANVVFNFWSVEALFFKVVLRPIFDVVPEDVDVVVTILPGLLVPYTCNEWFLVPFASKSSRRKVDSISCIREVTQDNLQKYSPGGGGDNKKHYQ